MRIGKILGWYPTFFTDFLFDATGKHRRSTLFFLVWSEAQTWTSLGDYYSVTGAGDGEGWQPNGGGSDQSHTRAPRLARIQVKTFSLEALSDMLVPSCMP